MEGAVYWQLARKRKDHKMIIQADSTGFTVIREDVPRASMVGARVRNESAFWYAVRSAINAARTGTGTWRKVNNRGLCKRGALTSMPYALEFSLDRTLLVDNDYAIRCPANAYNAGEGVRLQFFTVSDHPQAGIARQPDYMRAQS